MLTVYEDTEKIFCALAAGANGYLLKRSSPTKLLASVREVHGGGSPMTSSIARANWWLHFKSKRPHRVRSASPALRTRPGSLSPREATVLANGWTYKQLASELSISIDNNRTYIRRIYEKLHVQSRTEAVAKCLRP